MPALLVIFFLWLALGGLILFIEPEVFLALPLFFLLIFCCLLFTFSTLFAHARRGLLIAMGLTLFLLLRYFGIGNILNFLLILALGICLELYFIRLK